MKLSNAGYLLLSLLLTPIHAIKSLPCAPDPSTLSLFKNSSFVENIGVRSNGDLILALLTEPTLYTIDPSSDDPTPTKLHTFPDATGMAGITEIDDDIFAVTSAVKPNTKSPIIWKLDFSSGDLNVTTIGAVNGSQAINGITAVRHEDSPAVAILLADTGLGKLRRMDLETGEVETIASSDLWLPNTQSFALGINGIKTFGSNLYWTASFSGTFGHIPLTTDGHADGDVAVLAQLNRTVGAFDDFAINEDGLVFFATHIQNVMVYDINKGGDLRMLENNTELVQPTSAAFGRGKNDKSTLYITCGGQAISNSTYLAASVQKIDIPNSIVDACIRGSKGNSSNSGSDNGTSAAGRSADYHMAIVGCILGLLVMLIL